MSIIITMNVCAFCYFHCLMATKYFQHYDCCIFAAFAIGNSTLFWTILQLL